MKRIWRESNKKMIQVDRGKDFEVLVAGFDMYYVKNSSDSVSLIYLSSGGYSTWRQKGKTTGYPHTRILFFKNTCHQFCSTSVHGDGRCFSPYIPKFCHKPYRALVLPRSKMWGSGWGSDWNWQMAKKLLTTDKKPKIQLIAGICSKIYWLLTKGKTT